MSMYKVNARTTTESKTIIVPGSKTLGEIFAEAGIMTGRGQVSLDSATLPAGALDIPLEQYTTDEETTHVLACYPKLENAAKAVVVGGAIVVSSIVTPDELKAIAKYRPEALKLVNDKTKDVEYLVAIGEGLGDLNGNGAIFGSHTDSEGKATITIGAPNEATDIRSWAIENLGSALLKLNKVEQQFASQLDSIARDRAEVEASIVVG